MEKLNAVQASPQSVPPFNLVCQPFAAVCKLQNVALRRNTPAM